MPLASGTKLGPYEIQSPIGAGGMGEVYRARDTRLGRDVAVKILPQHLSSHPELKERFEREARAISSLNHPRICILHDVGHQNGIDFLVMEYLEGQSLADRLKKGPLPLKETLKMGMEVCEALEVAHRAGIVHRDLKPGNIMFTKTGAKLMDFGLAKAVSVGADSGAQNAPLLSAAQTVSVASPMTPLTTAGTVIGTIQYMSPEQIEGKPSDARSDIFALGAVLYESATGQRPFDGKSQISVASAILEKDPEPISKFQPLAPASFERVVNTCLEKNPDDRFQSAHDVRLALKWTSESQLQPAEPAAATPANKLTNYVPWVAAAIFAALAAAAIFLGPKEKVLSEYSVVSYREGTVQGARFSQDGQTIIYAGKWEGAPVELSVARVGSPESRPLGIPPGTIASVSATDELAVLLGCEDVYFLECGGTLATVSLAGGSPRKLAEHIAFADWSRDGAQFLVARVSSAGSQIEYPIGHVLLQKKSGWYGDPRFSPDGKWIAYEDHGELGNDEGQLKIMDLNANQKLAISTESLEGLAWTPDGKEVWFAGASNAGWADTIYATTLSGKKRAILTLPYLRLYDIAKDGRVLLAREDWRRQIRGFFPGDSADHPYSWLDDTGVTAITADGRFISFVEAGIPYFIEDDYLAYYRPTDGSPAVRLGAGEVAISPDGKWVAISGRGHKKIQLQPIGAGESRELSAPGLTDFNHFVWSDDNRYIAYEAQSEQKLRTVYVQDVAGAAPLLISDHANDSIPVLSSDGSIIVLVDQFKGISIYPVKGGGPLPAKGTEASEIPIRFVRADRFLLVAKPAGSELILTLVDLTTGRREPWKRLPTDAGAQGQHALLAVTPDLKYYAYPVPRYSSNLYTVSNLH
jgi:eukaryotic-like serine/threonine-protein kinase